MIEAGRAVADQRSSGVAPHATARTGGGGSQEQQQRQEVAVELMREYSTSTGNLGRAVRLSTAPFSFSWGLIIPRSLHHHWAMIQGSRLPLGLISNHTQITTRQGHGLSSGANKRPLKTCLHPFPSSNSNISHTLSLSHNYSQMSFANMHIPSRINSVLSLDSPFQLIL